MGKLSEVQIPRREISVAGSESTIDVRGLTPGDIDTVYTVFEEPIERLYADLTNPDREETPSISEVVRMVLHEIPDMAAVVIAKANDDEGNGVEIAMKLPLVTQVNALMAIVQMTIESKAAVKKILADLGLLDKMSGLVQALSKSTELTESPSKGSASKPSETSSGTAGKT